MGFVLSVLYFVTYYLTPATLFGPFAAFHIELILAVLVTSVSLLPLTRSFVLKTPQSLALIGMAIAVVMSVIIGKQWPGGALQAFLGFIPNAFGYFLVCLHCNSTKKLKILVLVLVLVCLFVIARGSIEEIHGFSESALLQPGFAGNPYVLVMKNDAGESFYRLRGLGEINDPNDFGQLIVCVIPLLFMFWRVKNASLNVVRVILPVSALLVGVYLTHSRGALVALLAVVVVAARRRIGTLPSLVVAGGLLLGAMALNFTGGREISAEAGSDRTALWGESLQLLKSHPLFGVGLGSLPDYLGHTAHNSVAVCAAELGLFGLYFWCMFLFPTARDVLAIASPARVSEGQPIVLEGERYPQEARTVEEVDKAEVNRLGRLMVLSLTGFLAAGWFLSRAFVMTFFLLGGMAEVVFEMAFRREVIAPRMGLLRVLPRAGVLAVSLIFLLYILLRTVHLTS